MLPSDSDDELNTLEVIFWNRIRSLVEKRGLQSSRSVHKKNLKRANASKLVPSSTFVRSNFPDSALILVVSYVSCIIVSFRRTGGSVVCFPWQQRIILTRRAVRMTASSLSPGLLCGLSLKRESLSSSLSISVHYMRDVRTLCQLRW